MDEQRFDEVTRQLANGVSRRRVLGGLFAGIAGVAGIRTASAANACSEFCRQFPPGPLRGRCRSDCAHETGLFFECEGDFARVCLLGDRTAACCESGQRCAAGGCATPPPPGCTSAADCDDGNPCTESVCGTDGECSHPPAAAGSLCGDGTICVGDVYHPADACDGNGTCIDGDSRAESCAPIDDCTPACSDAGCAQTSLCTGFDTCINGVCDCIPDCPVNSCGDDGCGGSCGDCDWWVLPGVCVDRVCCFPNLSQCVGRCGGIVSDTCGGTVECPPPNCPPGFTCIMGACVPGTGECENGCPPGEACVFGICFPETLP